MLPIYSFPLQRGNFGTPNRQTAKRCQILATWQVPPPPGITELKHRLFVFFWWKRSGWEFIKRNPKWWWLEGNPFKISEKFRLRNYSWTYVFETADFLEVLWRWNKTKAEGAKLSQPSKDNNPLRHVAISAISVKHHLAKYQQTIGWTDSRRVWSGCSHPSS